ncbi:meiotically up-regulated gene 113-domain-containing protein [Aspergillus coremiiformis]|uniref:Meiotically up-regulated gene 113-domain-containing protein n=1 Tax=Aspergillus coremiiformis TaxID=138285 RepID=A0A5N6Z183_9EURO|nr:meiotically up-regulated gene 113-domain-containing protein [Aspergillus coremiiformis]
MPVFANTPESLVTRTDSLDPATTCRGVTSNGRPCRRSLASADSPPSTSPPRRTGRQQADPTELYCWQHKDQAAPVSNATSSKPNNKPNVSQMQPRSSVDTLMDRLGILNINDPQDDANKHRPLKKKKKKSKRTFCCCFEIIEEDEPLPPRPRPSGSRPDASSQTIPQSMQQISSNPLGRPHNSSTLRKGEWIPSTLSPATTSILTAELAKPLSEKDEPGYIYIFWVTPSTSSKSVPPPSDVASSLFSKHERGSHAIQKARDLDALTSTPTDRSPGTIRLKIGRANNVQRRLNEWTRQCSNHLTLIRYYPYTPSAPGPSKGPAVDPGRKVPYVHRVERLVHLELNDYKVRDMGKCEECGKTHQEWFEIAAEKEAIRRVDECIRRWVRWAESQ